MNTYLHVALDLTLIENTPGWHDFIKKYAAVEYRPGVYLIKTGIKPTEFYENIRPWTRNSDVTIYQVDPTMLQNGVLAPDIRAWVGQKAA
jgi:hypothetical protein